MGRKRKGINAIRGERLRALLKEHQIEHKDLATRMNYSEEHMSYIINGKRNLTEDAAERIVEMFPGTRIGWLLGYEDYETNLDLLLGEAQKNHNIEFSVDKIFEFATEILGYQIELPNKCDADEVLVYLVKEGNRIKLTKQNFEELKDELVRYAMFLLEELNYKKNKPQHSLRYREEELGIG